MTPKRSHEQTYALHLPVLARLVARDVRDYFACVRMYILEIDSPAHESIVAIRGGRIRSKNASTIRKNFKLSEIFVYRAFSCRPDICSWQVHQLEPQMFSFVIFLMRKINKHYNSAQQEFFTLFFVLESQSFKFQIYSFHFCSLMRKIKIVILLA